MRQRGARAAHVGEHVELERARPVGVVELPPVRRARGAHVVDEHVEAAEALGRRGDGIARSPAAVARSAAMPTASCAPRCSSSAATAAARSASRPTTATRAPARASSCAVARPMPAVPPVTRQPRPSSPSSTAAIVPVGRPGTSRLECGRCRVLLARPPRRDRVERGTPLAGASRRPAQRRRARPRRRRWRRASRSTGRRALYSSDLPRARETAEEVAQRAGLEPVFDARWREVDVGEWLGLTPEEVAGERSRGLRALARRRHGLVAGRVVRRDGRARPRGRAGDRRAPRGLRRRRSCASRTAA